MKKYIVLLLFMFAFEGKLLAQEQAESLVSPEEAKVLQLAADVAEDREAAYKEMIKDPKLYLKYLRLAAKSDDPELQRNVKDLLLFGELGIKDSMNDEFIESVLVVTSAAQSEQEDKMDDLLRKYTKNRSLTEDEYMVLLDMVKVFKMCIPRGVLYGFILQQSTQGFKLPKISDQDPLGYVNYLLDKSPRFDESNKIIGCLFGIQGDSSKTDTSTHLVNSWRDLLLDPIAHEGRILGRHTNSAIENALDIALYRTDQLQRIFSEQNGDDMSPLKNLAYEWMHLSQMGKNPDRNEYFGMQTYPKDAAMIYSIALALLGRVDDVEMLKKYVPWPPNVDPNMYLDLVGYPSLDIIQSYAQKFIERIKKGSKNLRVELFYLTNILSYLDGAREFDMMHQLCAEIFPLLGEDVLTEFLENTLLSDRSRFSPTLQCELVDYAPGLANFFINQGGGFYVDEGGVSSSFSYKGLYIIDVGGGDVSRAELYKDALLRLFEGLDPREQHQMLLVTQHKITYWKDFLEEEIQALFTKMKAGYSYNIDDLYLLCEYLYRTGWEDLAFSLMSETKGASSTDCSIALYYTVLKLIEKGDISAAESFFNRYDPQNYSLNSSYYLAASEIAKAKKDIKKAEQYLVYAQVLRLLNSPNFYADSEALVTNLLRGSYMLEAERVQRMSDCVDWGLANYARMGDIYLARGDWHKARFYFEYARYASLVRGDLSYITPLPVYLMKSELAQAMFYMSQGELDKAQSHIALCLNQLVANSSMAEEVMGILCGPSAAATSEQKKQWRDQMLHSYQELQKKYPRDATIPEAIQYLQSLEPKTVSSVMAKDAETDRSSQNPEAITWLQDGRMGKQLAAAQKKMCIIVYLPESENKPIYKDYDPILRGKGLSNLLGLDAICVLLTPDKDGTWSPTNAQLLKQAAAMGGQYV